MFAVIYQSLGIKTQLFSYSLYFLSASNLSGLSNSGKFPSSSFKRSVDLETISECSDLKGKSKSETLAK